MTSDESKSRIDRIVPALEHAYESYRDACLWGALALFLMIHIVTLGALVEQGFLTVSSSELDTLDSAFQILWYMFLVGFGLYLIQLVVPLWRWYSNAE